MDWQPITSRKPKGLKAFEVVLLTRQGKDMTMPCYWDGQWKCATIFGTGIVYKDPTHWARLPAGPTL
jgi:hypothetical protein